MAGITYPHENEILRPVSRFLIGGRYLCLYTHVNRTPSAPYSFYWTDEENPLQHAMSISEVFNILSQELEKAQEESDMDAFGDNFDRGL